nr:hypothetical protein [Desulfosarcina alkanivorans]
MNRSILFQGRPNNLMQFRKGGGLMDPQLLASFRQGWLRTGPDHIVHRRIITEYGFRFGVHVDDGSKIREVDSPEIQKRAVLTEKVAVIGGIDGTFSISEEQDQPGFNIRFEALAPGGVTLSRKHERVLSYEGIGIAGTKDKTVTAT